MRQAQTKEHGDLLHAALHEITRRIQLQLKREQLHPDSWSSRIRLHHSRETNIQMYCDVYQCRQRSRYLQNHTGRWKPAETELELGLVDTLGRMSSFL